MLDHPSSLHVPINDLRENPIQSQLFELAYFGLVNYKMLPYLLPSFRGKIDPRWCEFSSCFENVNKQPYIFLISRHIIRCKNPRVYTVNKSKRKKKKRLVYFSLPWKVSIRVGKFQPSFIYFTLGNSGKLIVLFSLMTDYFLGCCFLKEIHPFP